MDVEWSSIIDAVHGANDLDRENVPSALRPLRVLGGDGGFKARRFPLSLLAPDGGSEGSGVDLGASAGPALTSSDPTLVYPRGARRLSQTRNVAPGTRRATAISSSSAASASTCGCSSGGSGSLQLGWCNGGSRLRSGRGRVTRVERENMRTAKVQGVPKPLFPHEFDIGFTPLVELTGIAHLVRFVISRTEEMGYAHGSLDSFGVFAAMFRNGAVDGSAPVKILDPRDT